MRIPRVPLPFPVKSGERVELPAREGHYLVNVLRRGAGDRVRLFSASEGHLEGVIAEVGGGAGAPLRVVVEVGERALVEGPPAIPWTVAAALIKGGGFDLAVRLASELGLERMIPLQTERAVVERGGGGAKRARWSRIAEEAARQCGRRAPLLVTPPSSLRELVEGDFLRHETAGRWIALPGAGFPAGEEFFEPAGGKRLLPACFLVGPEGGFSSAEIRRATEGGFAPLGFPTPLLRTPTAVALVGALGVLLSVLGEKVISH